MKKRIFIYSIVFLISKPFLAQSTQIQGTVQNLQKNPIPDTHLLLYNLNDSVNVVGTTLTNEKGHFKLNNIPQGDYKLVTSNIQYEKTIVYIQNLQQDLSGIVIQMKDRMESLNEITVTAKNVIREFDRQILFPEQSKKEASTNGIDLIDKLYLDKVYINKINNSIKSVQGGKVELRINGAPADEADFMNIDPKQVIRVEYHDRPSMRYGDTDAVIDFYVKRRDTGGHGNVYLNNRIDGKAVGIGRGGLTVNHKKSEFSISGFYSYLNLDDRYILRNENFLFGDGNCLSRYIKGLPYTMKERMYTSKASYSYYDPENILFSANVFYQLYETPNKLSTNHIFENGNPEASIYMTDSINFRDKKPSFEIYLQKNLKNKQLIAFDFVGTYMNTASYDAYLEYNKKEQTTTDILTNINGNKYSIIAEAFYEKRFQKGRLNAGLKETAGFADNTYRGTFPYQINMDQYTTTAYIQWYGNKNKFSYGVGSGITSDIKIQNDKNLSDFRIYPTINLGYDINRDINLYYKGRVNVRTPQLGNLNNVQLAKDKYLIIAGNPILEPETTYSNMLGVGLYKKRLMLSLDASYDYSVHPMLDCTFRQNNKFITQKQNGKYSHSFSLNGFIRWDVVPQYLNFYSRMGYNYRQNVTNYYAHSFNSWMLDTGLDAMYKDFTLGINAHKDIDYLNSETKIYRYFNLSFSLYYKWKNLKIGGVFHRALNPYIEHAINMNQYIPNESFYYLPSSNTDIRMTISWSFDFGRKKESGYQKLYNEDSIKGFLK